MREKLAGRTWSMHRIFHVHKNMEPGRSCDSEAGTETDITKGFSGKTLDPSSVFVASLEKKVQNFM